MFINLKQDLGTTANSAYNDWLNLFGNSDKNTDSSKAGKTSKNGLDIVFMQVEGYLSDSNGGDDINPEYRFFGSMAESPAIVQMSQLLKGDISDQTIKTADQILVELIELLSNNHQNHPLAINLAQQVMGTGLRSVCGDSAPIVALSNKVPSPLHVIIPDAASGLVQYLFNYPFLNNESAQLKKIEKYRLLVAVKKFFNSDPTKEELEKFNLLSPQIEKILGEQRHLFGAICQNTTKSQSLFHSIQSKDQQLSVASPAIPPGTSYITSKEHLELLNALFDNKINRQTIESAKNKIQKDPTNKTANYSILWQTLNNPIHYRKVANYRSRQTYLTPLQQLYADEGNKATIQDIYLGSVGKSQSDPLFTDHKELYNHIKDKLDKITKSNAIQTMFEIRILIDIALEKASNDPNQQRLITQMYRNLMSLQFDVNHGHIFKVANQQNQNHAILHESITKIRYGQDDSSLSEVSRSESAEPISRWMFFKLFGVNRGLLPCYISRTHTYNSCEMIHKQIEDMLPQLSTSQQDVVLDPDIVLFSFKENLPNTTIEDKPLYTYNRHCELAKRNGLILPNIIHNLLENIDAMTKQWNNHNIISRFGELALNCNIINEAMKSCSIIKFNQIAAQLFHGLNKDTSPISPQHPLIGLLLLFYLAQQDTDTPRKFEKLVIINNLIEKSTHDTSSVLHQTIKPSVLKYFSLEISLSIISSSTYGTSIVMSGNPLLLPVQIFVNYLSRIIIDTDFINWLSRLLITPNRMEAIKSIFEQLTDIGSDIDSYNSGKEHQLYENLAKNQFANPSVNLHDASWKNLQADQDEIAKMEEVKALRANLISPNPPEGASEDKIILYVDKLIEQLDLGEESAHITREMVTRNFLILLRLILHKPPEGQNELSSKVKQQCLGQILNKLKNKKLALQLNEEELCVSKSFTKFENILGAIFTLMPKFCSETITNVLTGTLIGAGMDAANSSGNTILRAYVDKWFNYSKNYQALIELVENEIECEKKIQMQNTSAD